MSTAPTTETCRPLRADARRNREKLLTAARAAVTEGGSDISLEEVARQAGVGIGTLYRHFPNRQALLEAAFLDQAEELRVEAESRADAADPWEALTSWLWLQLEFGSWGHSAGAAVMAAKQTEGTEIYTSCRAMKEAGAVLFDRAKAAGLVTPDADFLDVLRMMHAIVMVNAAAPDGPERDERMFELVVGGLRPVVEPASSSAR
jgi:AcrR family transcriptional regulator